MADIGITKFRVQIPRGGATPSTPGFAQSEGQDPVNPPGSPTGIYVPYLGATGGVNLGEFGLSTGYVTFDTTPTGTPATQGTTYWDDSKSTVALIMNGTTQHIGQDQFIYVKNSTGSPIAKGVAVRNSGTDGGSGHILIEPMLANGTNASETFLGVTAEAIANGSFGQVMAFGELAGINTSGYTAGAFLYVSTTVAGQFQTTAPVAPNNIILVGRAINSKNNGDIIIRPTIGSNINNDEGVKIVSPTNGQALVYNSTSQLWENGSVATLSGLTTNKIIKATSSSTVGDSDITEESATSYLFGARSGGATATPLSLSLGGTFGNNTVGSEANSKLKLFDAGVGTSYGIGISANLMEFSTPSGGFAFFPSRTRQVTILSGGNTGFGTATPTERIHVIGNVLIESTGSGLQYISLGNSFGSGTPGSSSNLKIRLFDNLGGIVYGLGISASLLEITSAGDIGFFPANTRSMTVLSNGNLSFENEKNIQFGTTTGTRIGTATSQKIGFWNATPIVQPTTAVASATRVGGGGTTLTDTDTFDGYTLAQIVKALRNAGLLA